MSMPRVVWRAGLVISALAGVAAGVYVFDEGFKENAYVKLETDVDVSRKCG